MRRMAAIAVCVLLASCGPSSGKAEVVEKWYRAAYMTTSYVKVGQIMVPIFHHHPESWSLVLLLREPKERRYTISVTETWHDSAQIGDRVWLWRGQVVSEDDYEAKARDAGEANEAVQ